MSPRLHLTSIPFGQISDQQECNRALACKGLGDGLFKWEGVRDQMNP